MRRTTFPLSILLTFLAIGFVLPGRTAGWAYQVAVPSGRQVVQRHIDALGGTAAFKAVASVHASGRFEIRDSGLSGTFELFGARPNKMLYRVTMPGIGVIENGFDGKVGWSLSPIAGPELLTGRQLDEAAEDAWFDGTLFEADRVKSLDTVERTTFDGRPAFKVRVFYLTGRDTTEYFDIETGHQIGTEAERATPEGIVPTTNILRDYKKFGAVSHPTVFIQRALGFEQVVTIASVEFNTVAASTFVPPASVTPLIGR